MLTTTAAAKALGLTPGRVRQMIRAGQLPAVKAGRDWLIEKTDLKLVETRRRRGRPRKEEYAMRHFAEVTYKNRIESLENGLPVSRLFVAIDARGDSYIVHGNNTGHISFPSKKSLIVWLRSLGAIKYVENTDPTLDKIPESLTISA